MIGWIVAGWFFLTGAYWCLRARKAERRSAMRQDECRHAIAAVVDAERKRQDAEQRSLALFAELKRATDALELSQKRDSLTASIAYTARRLH